MYFVFVLLWLYIFANKVAFGGKSLYYKFTTECVNVNVYFCKLWIQQKAALPQRKTATLCSPGMIISKIIIFQAYPVPTICKNVNRYRQLQMIKFALQSLVSRGYNVQLKRKTFNLRRTSAAISVSRNERKRNAGCYLLWHTRFQQGGATKR